MPWTANDPDKWLGKVVGTGHCVNLIREAAGLPPTSRWRRGALVREVWPPADTCVATFDYPGGLYGNHTDGRSHCAILLRVEAGGLVVIDQWQGQPCHERTIRFRGGAGLACDDGDAYAVIELDGG